MTIDERDLRSQLGAALDQFVPGQIQMPALIRQGKRIVVRRRIVTVAVVVSVIIAAAAITPLMLGQAADHPAPVSPTHYTVTQHSARLARPLALSNANNYTASAEIAYGRVNNRSWWLKLSVHAYLLSVRGRGLSSDLGIGYGGPPLNSRSGPLVTLVNRGGSPLLDYGIVRADVAYLRARLTNGQTLTVRPVAVFGQQYARYVAFAVPYNSAVTELTAYSDRAELGYAIPFTQADQLQIRWIAAGQPAVPAPASYLIGSGTAGRARWSVRLDVGPWGTCQVTSATSQGFPLAWCPVPGLGRGQVAQILGGTESWLTPKHQPARGTIQLPEIAVAQTASAVSYLILTRQDGSSFRAATVAVGHWRYCAFHTTSIWPEQRTPQIPSDAVVRWTAYDSSGRRLGSGSALG